MIEGENRYDVNDVTALLDAITTPLTHLTPGSLCRIGGKDLLGVAGRLEHAARLLYAAQLVITDEIQAQGVAQTMGSSSTAALLGEHLLIPRGQAKARIAAATATLSQDSMTGGALDPVLPELGAAIREGLVNPDQVRSIVDTMNTLPSAVDDETRDLAEKLMVEAAVVTPPAPFARFCRQIAAQLDQDGELPADHARDNVTLSLGRRNTRTGLTPLTGQLDDLTVQLLTKALDGLSAPRPSTECGTDPRPGPIRKGQAFGEMLRRYLNLGDAPTDHGARPHVSVTLTIDGLEAAFTEAAATGAVFDDGTPLSATMLRQLLCDATVLPIVLGGNGEILDVGRESRTFTAAIRKALVARDKGCGWPGCDRPASWCDGHHVDGWAALLGPTSINNGVLLCAHHHTEIHRGDWQVRIRNGRPEFLPPPWIDPDQQWRRNTLHDLAPPVHPPTVPPDRHQPTGT